MKSFKFWIPTIIGVLLTPFFLGVALISTGAGHGSYLSIMLFYPIPMLLLFLQPVEIGDAFLRGVLDNILVALAFGTAIIQFPLYGFIISYAEKKKSSRLWAALRICAFLHTFGSLLWLPYALLTRK